MADQVAPQHYLLNGLDRVCAKLLDQGSRFGQSLRARSRTIRSILSIISIWVQVGAILPLLLIILLILYVLVEVHDLLNACLPRQNGLLCQLNLRRASFHFSNLFGHYFVHQLKWQFPYRLDQSNLVIDGYGGSVLPTVRRRIPQLSQPRIMLPRQSHLLFDGH